MRVVLVATAYFCGGVGIGVMALFGIAILAAVIYGAAAVGRRIIERYFV